MSTNTIQLVDGHSTSKYATKPEAMEQFLSELHRQEQTFVAAGFPADGITEFFRRWWDSWNSLSMEKIRENITDNITYADTSLGNQTMYVGQQEVDFWSILLKTLHANAYYQPLADQTRRLPMWDFADGMVRLTVPYRIVGHFGWPFSPFDVELVDRYEIVRDPQRGWLLSRIDTNGDLFWAALQILPIPIRPPSQRTVRAVQSVLLRLVPSLRGPVVRPFAPNHLDV